MDKKLTKLEYEQVQRFAKVLPADMLKRWMDSNYDTVVNIIQKIEASGLLDDYSLTNLEVFLNLALFLVIEVFYFEDEQQEAYEYSEKIKKQVQDDIFIENKPIDRKELVKQLSKMLKHTEYLLLNNMIGGVYEEVSKKMDGRLDELIEKGYIK